MILKPGEKAPIIQSSTRLDSVFYGHALVKIIPSKVTLEMITYKQERKAVRVTGGGDRHLELSEYTWM